MCLNVEQLQSKVELELNHLSKRNKETVSRLISKYKPQKRAESLVEMKIILKDDIPVYQRPRRVPFADQIVVDNQIAEWLQEGIMQPSFSEYASPIVLAPKKDGSKRLCCDFRNLKKKIERDNFPKPLIDVVLDKLQGAKVYTTLNLANGFFIFH